MKFFSIKAYNSFHKQQWVHLSPYYPNFYLFVLSFLRITLKSLHTLYVFVPFLSGFVRFLLSSIFVRKFFPLEYLYCYLHVVTIDRERLISEKQNNKASAEGARLPKEAMLLRDIFKYIKPSLGAFRPFGLISRAC